MNATGYWKKKPAGRPFKQSQATRLHLRWGVGNHLLLKQASNLRERSRNTRPSCWTLAPNQVIHYRQLLINEGGSGTIETAHTILQTEGKSEGGREELSCMPEQRHHRAKGQRRYGRIRGLMDTAQQC